MDFSSPGQELYVLLFIAAWAAYLSWCLSNDSDVHPPTRCLLEHNYRFHLRAIRQQGAGTSGLRSMLGRASRSAKPALHHRVRVLGVAHGSPASCADLSLIRSGFRVLMPVPHLSNVPVFRPVLHLHHSRTSAA